MSRSRKATCSFHVKIPFRNNSDVHEKRLHARMPESPSASFLTLSDKMLGTNDTHTQCKYEQRLSPQGKKKKKKKKKKKRKKASLVRFTQRRDADNVITISDWLMQENQPIRINVRLLELVLNQTGSTE